MTATAYIALGSNLGDRRGFLDQALAALRTRPGIEVVYVSSYHETAPVGGPPGQGNYLNAAAELRTTLEPQELLRVLLDVEQTLGRERHERFGPRTIDLDLLLYGEVVCDEPDLIVPHPRMHERRFVLEPLAEIGDQVVHPVLKRTVRFLLEKLQIDEERQQLTEDEKSFEENLRKSQAEFEQRIKAQANPGVPYFLDRELAGLRALVTGSTSGIGRVIALELGAAGADVIIHGRNPSNAEKVVGLIRHHDVRAGAVLVDLRGEDACLQLANRAWNQWNGLDILVCNAGADILTGDGAKGTFENKLNELLAVDVRATMLLSRTIGERMKTAGSGVILTMGWDQAETGMEGDSGQLFGAAKGAVMAFTRSLACTLAPQVRVNCLAPGWIRTAWGEQASATWQERVKRETLLQRWGTSQDVAAAAHWLVSPAAAFITGQIIRVNGGAVR
jgi:3-oxoacyl-[acyl-carrier protein] reductase